MNEKVQDSKDLHIEDIRNTILGLADAFARESEDKYGTIAEGLLNGSFSTCIDKPETFNILFFFPLTQIIEMVYRSSMAIKGQQPVNDKKSWYNPDGRLAQVAMNYGLFKNVVGSLIETTEGSGCYVDKASWIINCYCHWIRTGQLMDMTIDRKCYWKPGYGDAQDWIDLCEGVYFMLCQRIGVNALESVTKAHNILVGKYKTAGAEGAHGEVTEMNTADE